MKYAVHFVFLGIAGLIFSACALNDSAFDRSSGSELEIRDQGERTLSPDGRSVEPQEATLHGFLPEGAQTNLAWVNISEMSESEQVDPGVTDEAAETPDAVDEPSEDPSEDPMVSGSWSDYDVSIPYAVLQGQLGALDDIDGMAYRSMVWGSDMGLNSSVYWQTDTGVAMLLFDLTGALEILRSGGELDRWGDAHGTWIAITGCAGPVEDNWDFDAPPDDVILHYTSASDDPNYLILTFTARFGSDVIDGKFEVLLTPRA